MTAARCAGWCVGNERGALRVDHRRPPRRVILRAVAGSTRAEARRRPLGRSSAPLRFRAP